ncbi:MAG: AgrD family cyclic lactone autoinducer peptide [Eubacterium sp.]|nr:hypothetical protein [Eubacterium sp.]
MRILDTVLKLKANSASCIFLYESKTPERFKKTK